MSKQDELQYEQQEKRIQAQSDAFITLLTKGASWGTARSAMSRNVWPDRKRRKIAITTH